MKYIQIIITSFIIIYLIAIFGSWVVTLDTQYVNITNWNEYVRFLYLMLSIISSIMMCIIYDFRRGINERKFN
jgi:uncharacterized membrane protein